MKVIAALLSVVACCLGSPLQHVAPTCGVPAIKPDTTTDIIGGKDAIPYSWPWQVSIYRKRNETYYSHTCGGAVISNQWILTAAHCFADKSLDTYKIKLGVFNQFKEDEPGEKILKLSEIHVHPRYGWVGTLYDVAVLKLAEPLEFNDHVSPVCLPAKTNEELPEGGTPIFLTGWGKTRPGKNTDTSIPVSDTLKQLGIPIISKDECNKLLGILYRNVMLCVGGPGTGKSACFGDSGGPSVVQGSDGAWKQIGIASFVTEATCQGHSGYTKVSTHLDFIKQYVKDV